MALKIDDALKKVTALEGVKAAFVFDQFLSVVSRDVPGNYANEVLKRIANQLYQIAILSRASGVVTQEFRLVYDQFAVYARLFAGNHYLVVFMDRGLESTDFRQPINLSVLVLEKALRIGAEENPSGPMTEAALLAEQSLRAASESGGTFVGRLRHLCFTFLGLPGRELVDNGVDDEVLVLPLKNEHDMRRLADYVLARIPHPVLRKIMEQDVEDVVKSALKQID